MRIQHNITALNANRNLTWNNNAVGKSLEKLSSGYRINRAGDDAAGLAVSEKMRAQISCLTQAETNCNDGISLIQTAEGALNEVHDMLNRMVELSEQSANGTYDQVDRDNLQAEVEQLKSEIDRISEATNFNGINLLDGSLSGSGTGNGLTGAKIVNFKATEFTTTTKVDCSAATLGAEKLIIDGTEITVDWSKLSNEDKDALKMDWSKASAAQTKEAAEIMQNTINDAINEHNQKYGSSVNEVTVESNAAGTFTFKSGLDGSEKAGISVAKAAAKGYLATVTSKDSTTQEEKISGIKCSDNFQEADIKGKFKLSIDGEEVEVDLSTITLTSSTGDTHANVDTLLKTAISSSLQKYDAAKGYAAGSSEALDGKLTVELNEFGQLQINNTTGKKVAFSDYEGDEFAKNLGISLEGKATMDGGLTLQIGDTADDFNKLNVSIQSMSSDSLGVASINIATQNGASAAIEKVKSAINTVSSTRGNLGAMQNRLEHTINNLSVTNENITNAESRIRDTDMAKEMMAYTSKNIISQAAQSMLAQANQQPQQVLSLLQ